MDDTPKKSQASQLEAPASEFNADMILAVDSHDELSRDREFHIRWYNALPAESQAEVRDKIRDEILRIRSAFGKRTQPIYPLPARRREQG